MNGTYNQLFHMVGGITDTNVPWVILRHPSLLINLIKNMKFDIYSL